MIMIESVPLFYWQFYKMTEVETAGTVPLNPLKDMSHIPLTQQVNETLSQ